MLIEAKGIAVAFGPRVVLDGVSFEVAARARVALVGRNGAGKTTLLRVLQNELVPDAGEVRFAEGVRVGWLAQRHDDAPGRTVQDVVRAALVFVGQLEARLRDLEERMALGEAVLEAYTLAEETFAREGGYTLAARVGRVLAALQLGGLLLREACTLSGGERTRLALACALLEQPDVLVLDEPTNHLDIGMREWLEGALLHYPGALVVVSHDRRLLDVVAKETWMLEDGALLRFKGGFSSARMQHREARRVQGKQARLGAREVARLQSSARRVADWNKGNDTLQRRAKAISGRAERLQEKTVQAPLQERKLLMYLAAGDARAPLLLRLENASKVFEERVVLRGVGLRVRAGDRVALLAPNGAGKTTLLRVLMGEESVQQLGDEAPVLRFADGVTVAYFDQRWHGLTPQRGLLAQLEARVPTALAKSLLGRYGFRAEDWGKTPSQLSGGESARAGLALVAATRADVLVLDEPTNHLDVEVLELLEDALLAYPGSIVFVTHDREFARAVATRVCTIENAALQEFERGFEGYVQSRRGRAAMLDPGRVFEDEKTAPPEPEDPLVLLADLEQRLEEIDELFLQRGLTAREAERLRMEAKIKLVRRDAILAVVYAAPVWFSHRVRVAGFWVLGDFATDDVQAGAGSGDVWRFWLEGADASCPQLFGVVQAGVLSLRWTNAQGQAWFLRCVLRGATQIAFEHLGVHSLGLPETPNVMGDGLGVRVSSGDYAEQLGLLRATKTKKRWGFHGVWQDWARARFYRRQRKTT